MAKIKYSALVSDMRNKLNGSVMSKNRYGSYVRNKVTPVNPQSIYQQQSRNLFGSASSAWRGLSDSLVIAWNEAAKDFPFTDIFGDVKHLSGQALFVQLNKNLLQVGKSIITTAPQPEEIPGVILAGITFDGTKLNVVLSEGTIPTGFNAIVYATPPVSAGISYLDNRYRMLASFSASTDLNEQNLLLFYQSRFGQDPAQKIGMRIVLVSLENGQMGVPSSAQTVIT